MRTINRVILVGRLGSDPKARGDAGKVASLWMATNRSIKKDDQWEEVTDWHSVVAFGKQAENCIKYLHKGSQLAVEGRLNRREWQTNDGDKRVDIEVVAENVMFLGPKEEGGGKPASDQGTRGNTRQDDDDDDIPF